MQNSLIDRRTVLAGTTALGAAAILPSRTSAQSASSGSGGTLPAQGEFVIRGAYVLSMDDGIGDFPSGDVHVKNGAIVAVGASVNAPGAEVIDGKGTICMPGFVDTHWHHWTTFLRPALRADDPKKTYFPVTFALGVHYTPEDSYRSVRLGLAEAISAGITTTHNWAHNVRSPAHADAEVRAMRDSGLRGRFAYGPSLGIPNTQPMDLADWARIKKDIGKDPMISLGICSRNVDASNASRGAVNGDMARKEWGAARELGLPITLHTNGSANIKFLADNNLLGPDVQLVHPLNLAPDDFALLAKHDVHYSTSPVGEAGRTGETQLSELLTAGVKVSISVDNVTAERCDCFACMHMLQTLNRHRNAGKYKLTTKRLVQMATIDGAIDLGLADQTGSLKPGKRADIILVRTGAPSIRGTGSPYDALVQMAQASDIDTVVADGRILKRKGAFTALDYDKVVTEANAAFEALKTRAKWS
ncbi:MAG TPA: amidohydrolase family protein [Pseudolabrys sp.]|nr:amidohydrolase family protein [Pseudolabrys sp.]